MKPAPVVDPFLARLFAQERNPIEVVVDDQISAKGVFVVGISHADLLKAGRVVKLACGHFTLTKALRKAGCPRCGEMVRAGYDYDSFRHLGWQDDFSWPNDPFRAVHERGESRLV